MNHTWIQNHRQDIATLLREFRAWELQIWKYLESPLIKLFIRPTVWFYQEHSSHGKIFIIKSGLKKKKIWLDIRKHHKEIIDKWGPGCSRARTVFIVRNEMFPGISVNKTCNSHQQLPPPQKVRCEPWGNSGRKEYLSSKRHQAAATPYSESQGSSGGKKYRLLTSDSWGACQKNDFSESKLLHLSIHRLPRWHWW